jgi:Ca2+-binding RTX toxin-like protein
VLLGGDGNDLLRGGLKNDYIDGGDNSGAGIDTVSYNYRGGDVTVNLDGNANDGELATGELDNVLNNVENVIGGSGRDKFIGSAADNLFIGGAGNDTFNGGDGNDTFVNRNGDSAGAAALDNDSIDGGNGFDYYQGDTRDTFKNVERNYDADPSAPSAPPAFPASPAPVWTATPSAGSFLPAAPPPTFSGGILTVNGDGNPNNITVNQTTSTITVTIDGTTYTRSTTGVARIDVNGLGGNDVIKITGPGRKTTHIDGGAGNDNCSGGAGTDIFLCGAAKDGNDTMTGGGGEDKADYASRTGALVLSPDGVANDGEFTGGERDNIAADIEYLFCGTGADVVDASKSSLGYIISGGAGKDTITGSSAHDNLIGCDGQDLLIGGAGPDTFTLVDNEADRYRPDGTDIFTIDPGLDTTF